VPKASPTVPPQAYAKRRRALARCMGDGVALVMGHAAAVRSRDDEYPFHQNPHFLYLTGIEEPDCAMLLEARSGRIKSAEIFVRPRSRLRERWEGARLGPARASKAGGGFTGGHPIGKLGEALTNACRDHDTLFHSFGASPAADSMVTALAKARRIQNRSGIPPIAVLVDWAPIIDEMRLVKRPEEMRMMRRAADIAVQAHIAAMRAVTAARREHEVEAVLIGAYRARQATHAFNPIVASGRNAYVLHHTVNDSRIDPDGMVLVDSGCQYGGYCSDITRTYPAGGRFTEPQREIYEVVLAAQKSAIRAVRPGNPVNEPEKAARRTMVRGLKRLGVISKSASKEKVGEILKRHYPHRIGHWLGMDVHDVGPYVDCDSGAPLRFEPGMVITIEPGLYFDAAKESPARYRGIGVRIEDDIAVTETGNENLTAGAPKSVADLERLIAEG